MNDARQVAGPAPRPCESCPYRRDVPSGVWAPSEYARLPAYDAPTFEQPPVVFMCHQTDRGSPQARLCAGWVGCHDTDESLSLRLAVATGDLSREARRQVAEYVSPVPLFASGAEAARHGMARVEDPDAAARRLIGKIGRRRTDLRS